jgi:hypothetical protein
MSSSKEGYAHTCFSFLGPVIASPVVDASLPSQGFQGGARTFHERGRRRAGCQTGLGAQPHSHSGAGALTLTYTVHSISHGWHVSPVHRGSSMSFGTQGSDWVQTRLWLPPLHQRPKPNDDHFDDDHFGDEKRDHNLKDGRASPAPGGWALSSEESGRNKPSIPWMGDGGVFAAASFGPPTPTFWLEAGPEVFACTEREGRVFNVGLNPPCTPRAGVHCCSASARRQFRP